MRTTLLLLPVVLAGCVAAPPPLAPPPPLSATLAPGAQDPALARDAALDGFATSIPDASRVSQHDVTLPTGPTGPTGPIAVTDLSLPDRVFFDFGVAEPRADAGPSLDALARAIRASPPDSVLTIAGNTDAIGTAGANRILSEARARAVVAALVERGVDPARLAAIGFGATRPIAPNDTDEGRALNRRVELALSPSFAANAASFTALVPLTPVAVAPQPMLARKPAPLDVRPNRPDPIQRNSLGPPVTY